MKAANLKRSGVILIVAAVLMIGIAALFVFFPASASAEEQPTPTAWDNMDHYLKVHFVGTEDNGSPIDFEATVRVAITEGTTYNPAEDWLFYVIEALHQSIGPSGKVVEQFYLNKELTQPIKMDSYYIRDYLTVFYVPVVPNTVTMSLKIAIEELPNYNSNPISTHSVENRESLLNMAKYEEESRSYIAQTGNQVDFLGFTIDNASDFVEAFTPQDKNFTLTAHYRLREHVVLHYHGNHTSGGYLRAYFADGQLDLANYPGDDIILEDWQEFVGWSEIEGGEVVTKTQLTSADAGKHFYAVVRIKTFRIGYHTNGGTIDNWATSDNRYTTYTVLTLPQSLIPDGAINRGGCNFAGWYLDEALTDGPYTKIENKRGDLDFYAKWEIITYSLTIYLPSGSGRLPSGYTKMQSDYIFGNDASTKYDVYTKDGGINCEGVYDLPTPALSAGYEFSRYFLRGNVAEDIATIEKPRSDYEVIAVCPLIHYKITYHIDENCSILPDNWARPKYYYTVLDSVKWSEQIFVKDDPTTPKPDDYELVGWYFDEALTIPATDITAGHTGNIEVWPKWIKKVIVNLWASQKIGESPALMACNVLGDGETLGRSTQVINFVDDLPYRTIGEYCDMVQTLVNLVNEVNGATLYRNMLAFDPNGERPAALPMVINREQMGETLDLYCFAQQVGRVVFLRAQPYRDDYNTSPLIDDILLKKIVVGVGESVTLPEKLMYVCSTWVDTYDFYLFRGWTDQKCSVEQWASAAHSHVYYPTQFDPSEAVTTLYACFKVDSTMRNASFTAYKGIHIDDELTKNYEQLKVENDAKDKEGGSFVDKIKDFFHRLTSFPTFKEIFTANFWQWWNPWCYVVPFLALICLWLLSKVIIILRKVFRSVRRSIR